MSDPAPISPFARTPEPPYHAVIFTSLRREGDDGYADMAKRMMALALAQPGCLGAESARDPRGFGLTVAYFATEADIAAWRDHAEHRLAQELGRAKWYAHYEVRIARVERVYSGPEKL
ncbi:antibiotic biosynthesis monooxygenase [Rhodoblastus sp.]|uniref:antibiotic biosynthesis monooxygenase family protein n=1 Tax=Rhodoblastus sp. TaxID=1962975 RepID=UPI00263308DB|nr:antibiotic biosynthesis monooxygenase [Rhodoblastus sp.]